MAGQQRIRAAERRAEARARTSPSGIGAAIAERLEPDAERRPRYRVRIADGRIFGWLLVTVEHGGPTGQALEAAIEQRAAGLPAEGRLDALEALGPMIHPAG